MRTDDDLSATHADTEAAATRAAEERVSLPAMFVAGSGDVRYERGSVLGEGGMGIVELHKDHRIGRNVAMKILRSDLADDISQRRFLREAQLQGQLEHPAIVPVYDIGERSHQDGAMFFTMKRVNGVTLHEVVKGLRDGNPAFEKYSRRKLLNAFSQVCVAIDFAHSRGVVHRDLKPANIMLGDFGEVYVLDWGIAKLSGADDEAVDGPLTPVPAPATQAGAMLGTPGYMAPEQLNNEEIGPKTDVYSLGAILFELLAREPFHKRGRLEVVISSTLSPGDARPGIRAPHLDIPPELDLMCVRALALDPKARYGSARELRDQLENYLDGERDQQLRREKAAEYVADALRAVKQAEEDSEAGFQARRRAMKLFGRIRELDPKNPDWFEPMKRLMLTPMGQLPPEVVGAVEHGELLRLKKIAWLGALSYSAAWLFFPLLLLSGIGDPVSLAGLYAGLSIAAVSSFIVYKLDKPNQSLVIIPMVASSAGFGFIAGMLGPLIFIPTVAVVNTVAYTIHTQRRYRWVVFLCGIAAFLVPLGLEIVSVIPPTYSFSPEGMLVMRANLSESWTIAVLALAQVFAVTLGVFIIAILRDYINRAELSTYTYAWHLREWLPDEHKREIDPVNRRRTR